MKTGNKRISNNRGSTYVLVVIVMILFGTMLAAYLKMVSHENQLTMRSQTWNRSVAVLEAGIEEAIAHLNKNAAADLTGTFNLNLTADGWGENPGGGWIKTNTVGEDYYVVTIGSFNVGTNYPNITSEGFVKQIPTFASRKWVGPFLAQAEPNRTPTTTTDSGTIVYTKRQVLCTTTNVPTFTKALVAKDKIDLNGNNIRTDSYDSRYPGVWSTAEGKYPTGDPSKIRDHGDIGTNGKLLEVGNANVYGNVSTGPNGTVNVGSQGCVGDFAYHKPSNYGTIQTGHFDDDMNVEMPDIQLPFTSGLPAEGGINWTNGLWYDTVFANGNYVVSNMRLRTLVTGNARVVVNGNINLTGNDVLRIAPGASLVLYMNGTSASIGGRGLMNPGVSTNFYYFGTTNNTSIDFGGNGELTGVIYAPNAAFTGNGGGTGSSSEYRDFCGAAVVKSASFNGHYSFHYDEALPRVGLYSGYVITSWNEK